MHREREAWLRQMGVSFMLGHDMQANMFFWIQVAVGICFMCLSGFMVEISADIRTVVLLSCVFFIGFSIPIPIVKMSNKMDNDAMLYDIKNVYDTLKIQMKAGVYVSDVLAECYLIVKNRRFKNALRELANEIYTKHDLTEALEKFNGKFKNVYIDMLAMTLEQSLQSGQSVQMLGDISQQIQEVEHALFMKAKQKAGNQMLAFQLAVYFGILLIVIFAMYHELVQAFY